MLEFIHDHLVWITFIGGFLAGGAAAFASVITVIILDDVQKWLPEPPKHRHTMDITADRDAIAEAVGAFN